jgi:hypothetical protein
MLTIIPQSPHKVLSRVLDGSKSLNRTRSHFETRIKWGAGHILAMVASNVEYIGRKMLQNNYKDGRGAISVSFRGHRRGRVLMNFVCISNVSEDVGHGRVLSDSIPG